MTRLFHHAVFAAGLIVIAWMGAGYVPGSPLGAAVVLLIGAVYLAGALELQRFRQATAGLDRLLAATAEPPPALAPWLAALDPGLHNAVRLRVEGERVALPGPALTPYLAGLLVLLGMLGTFLGMVATLKGTGAALEHAADVAAIRASLAAPVQGLGLAFGTSVAGVAASAALGLMSALARRERQRTGQRLDLCAATTLRRHSRAHQRDEALRLLAAQAGAGSALVGQLQALSAQMAQQGLALHEQLLAGQAQFQAGAQAAYTGLAASVDRSLQRTLAESARQVGAAIEPAVQATMAGLAQQATALHAALGASVQGQLDGASTQLASATTRVLAGVERQAAATLRSVADTQAASDAAAAVRERERMAAFHDGLAALSATLLHTAAEAPRAAAEAMAELLAELRRAHGDSLARDNEMLQERSRLLAALASQVDAAGRAGSEQRAAIDALVRAAADTLDAAGAHFAATAQAGTQALQGVAVQLTGSAAEAASLGEGFGAAVQQFSQASGQLMAQLQRIEVALGHSMARSDEQLAYYVAQAREIIDLTLGSQKQIVEDLQQLARAPAEAAAA